MLFPIEWSEEKELEKKNCTVRLNFQKHITSSQATLPVVGVMTVVLWFVLPAVPISVPFSDACYGLWQYVPLFLQESHGTLIVSLLCAALGVYMLTELNNTNVLLRVSSRVLDSILAVLLTIAVMEHRFQPGSVVMLFSLLSFFPLFSTYQQPSPLLSFFVYLLLSLASLVFPKLLWMVPVYWFIQGYFRAFSLRCFVSSLLALLLPYWVYGCIAILMGAIPIFWTHVVMVADFQRGDYVGMDIRSVIAFAFVLLLLVSGAIDFYVHQFLDKTRTRILYNAIIMHGVYVVLFLILQPQYFLTIFPLLLIDTAIVFGHFFALTHTRFSHIYMIVLLVLAVLVLSAQYLFDTFVLFVTTSG